MKYSTIYIHLGSFLGNASMCQNDKLYHSYNILHNIPSVLLSELYHMISGIHTYVEHLLIMMFYVYVMEVHKCGYYMQLLLYQCLWKNILNHHNMNKLVCFLFLHHNQHYIYLHPYTLLYYNMLVFHNFVIYLLFHNFHLCKYYILYLIEFAFQFHIFLYMLSMFLTKLLL